MKDLIKDLKVVMVSGLDTDFKDKTMEKLITSYVNEKKAFSLQGVGCSTFFKVKFAYDLSKQGRSNWRVDEKIFDVKEADELDVKIKKYISECSNRNVDRWYYMSKTSIEKL